MRGIVLTDFVAAIGARSRTLHDVIDVARLIDRPV
jgi:hypothetical protein